MTQGFIDPRSPFAQMAREAAAEEWGKRAADAARSAGQSVDARSVAHWLDCSEPADAKQLRQTNRAAWEDLHDRAAETAQVHARLPGIWHG